MVQPCLPTVFAEAPPPCQRVRWNEKTQIGLPWEAAPRLGRQIELPHKGVLLCKKADRSARGGCKEVIHADRPAFPHLLTDDPGCQESWFTFSRGPLPPLPQPLSHPRLHPRHQRILPHPASPRHPRERPRRRLRCVSAKASVEIQGVVMGLSREDRVYIYVPLHGPRIPPSML